MERIYSDQQLKAKGSKQQYAYDYLRTEIIMNNYLPGEALVEKDLCEKLGGISRTPVRDALLKLSCEGLVENVPGQGMKVADLKFEDLFEILELRIPIEKAGVKMFIERSSENDKKRLVELYEAHCKAWEEDDLKTAVTLDNQFHKLLAEGSANSLLLAQVEMLIDQSGRSAYYTVGDKKRIKISLAEHKKILDAVLAGNGEAAAAALDDHLISWSHYMVDMRMKRYFLKQRNK